MTAVVSVVNASAADVLIAYAGRHILCQRAKRGVPMLTRDVPETAWTAWASLPGNAALVTAGKVYSIVSPSLVAA